MKRLLLMLCSVLSIFVLASCEDEDLDNINQAQSCLDKVDAANYADAENCYDYLDDVSGEQAALLRCSIALFAGGITPQRISNSVTVMSNNSNQGEAYLITALAMDNTTKASTSASYCEKSGNASMKYISNLAVIGTQFAAAGSFLGDITSGGSNFSPDSGDITAALTGCAGDNACESAIGSALVPLAEDYCSGSGADQSACSSVTDAVDAAGGDEERMGELFLCLMQNPPIAPGSCP